jgi:diaminohydroxyphosphoribosylaminopyrimidine deaminase/5-amino-6-(5-phosphoribosylamino)uracil reductase
VVRIVADSHLRTPLTATLAVTARHTPTWLLIREGTDPERRRAFAELGATLIEVAGAELGIDPGKALAALGDAGLTRVLVEGGAQLAASLLRADLVDRIAWFQAPAVMGADAWPAVQAFGIDRLEAMPRFVRTAETQLGEDMLIEFGRKVG